ncbi:MAG TPA: methyltransferase domain-containing protein [Rhizomicrobium sp.]|nr:methyltransferase domain-containing protein [Rhizomicrobium sp.]
MRHCGKTYHEFMLASPRDQKVRARFREIVFRTMPPRGIILDFGAGTGIDAREYAEKGFRVLVHEPSQENLAYLTEHCSNEIRQGLVAITDMSDVEGVEMIAANFAVLNLIGDPGALFAKFAGLLAPRGFVLVSLLNPFFLGDARYAWWRSNLRRLIATGAYAIDGEFDRIHRFAPSFVRRAARPGFALVRCVPDRAGLALSQYVFMLFQKQ